MVTLTSSAAFISAKLPIVKNDGQFRLGNPGYKLSGPCQVRLPPQVRHSNSGKVRLVKLQQPRMTPVTRDARMRSTIVCAAALNARCGNAVLERTEQKARTMTNAPSKDEVIAPRIYIYKSGTGLPPCGGGGGGGGGDWNGGLFFFGFLLFLSWLKDQESEGDYAEYKRRPYPQF